MLSNRLYKIILIFVSLLLYFFASKVDALAAASFSLSPSSGVCIPDGTFTLDIVLTSDEPTSGATAIINYDSDTLEAQEIIYGDIFPQPLAKSINPDEGTLRLDMGVDVADPDYFTGEGVFGRVRFKVLGVGSASLSFDFTEGSTTDSNVAHAETHQDILASASGGSYTFKEDNTDPSLDPSCASGGETTPTPTPTPTTPAGDGGDGAATPTPTTPPVGDGGQAPEGGILGPTFFISALGILMLGAGALLGLGL